MKPSLREEKKLWRRGYKYIAGLDEAGRGCEKPDAEVLTSNGWKFYNEINFKKDKVLSYINDGCIKWQKIEKVIEKDFEGTLIELKNRGIHIVVTPDHYFTVLRRVSKRDKNNDNRLKLVGYKTRKKRKRATELVNNDFIPRGGKWKGVNKIFFTLPKVDKNEEKFIDIKLWVAFLGIFLSEGSVDYDKKNGSYRIIISQSKNASPNKYKKIYHLLKKFPFRFSECEQGFRCFNKQLYAYLKQFGDCYTKFIPKDIKELPPLLLNIFIKWLVLGDGTCYTGKNRKEVCLYYTVSKRLRDDLEEVLLKAGWTYHTSVRAPRDRYIKGRKIKKENTVPCFEIRLRRNNKAQIKFLHKNEVFYKGKVFCLQLPNHHNFYVRRNGAGYFTGNSLAGPVVAAAALISVGRKTKSVKLQPKTKNLLKKVKDSKKLSPKKRKEVYKLLIEDKNIEWGIGEVGEKVIDRINILEATKLAMKRAVKNLNKKLNQKIDFLILDGIIKVDLPISQKSIIKGDNKVFSCASASIIAKVKRDETMKRYDKKYPKYGFSQHKGYATKEHLRALRKYGPCRIHRFSFKPVKNVKRKK